MRSGIVAVTELAALTADNLRLAYAQGVFPWFNANDPVLWWSPNPRMVLSVENFHMRRSFKKVLRRFIDDPLTKITMDLEFPGVMAHCAQVKRSGQSGESWIQPSMVAAYTSLHQQGLAHSVEVWQDQRLVGGLYCVAIGQAVFGESMFSLQSFGSQIALAALLAFCRANAVEWIDCQQNTAHLASFGAHEISQEQFLAQLRSSTHKIALEWCFDAANWQTLAL
jgi:leucyl/phenylalanyl-tRNA---protein transferase